MLEAGDSSWPHRCLIRINLVGCHAGPRRSGWLGVVAATRISRPSTHSPPTHRHPSWYSPLRSQKRSNASSRASNTARLRARARSNHRPQKSRNKRRKRSRKVAPISVYSITADSLPLPINDPALNEE